MQALSTREAARQVGLTQDTVRWYERIGSWAASPRGGDGRRRFGEPDLAWPTLLTRLGATGMPIAQNLEYAELLDTTISIYRSRLAAERS